MLCLRYSVSFLLSSIPALFCSLWGLCCCYPYSSCSMQADGSIGCSIKCCNCKLQDFFTKSDWCSTIFHQFSLRCKKDRTQQKGCSVVFLQGKCQLWVVNSMRYWKVSTEKHSWHNLALYLSLPMKSHSFKAAIDKNLHGETDETNRVSDSTSAKAEGGFDPMVLGQQFCQWFFQLLNSQNPSLGQQPQDWGPQHFWPDVKLRLLSR